MRYNVMIIILAMAVVTFLTRIGAFALFKVTGVPPWLHRWIKPVPIAILTALIVPSLLMPQDTLDISLSNHYLLSGIVAALVAYKSKSIVWTLGLGMTTMVLLKVVGG
ncbi:AzlD domain-containing protein [Alkaliphilus crotonatoxidans]